MINDKSEHYPIQNRAFFVECCLCGEFSDEDRGLVVSWICGTSPFVFWTQEQMEQIAPSQPSGGSQDSMQNMMNIFNRIAQLRNIGGRVVGNMNNMLQLGRRSRNEDGDSPASNSKPYAIFERK